MTSARKIQIYSSRLTTITLAKIREPIPVSFYTKGWQTFSVWDVIPTSRPFDKTNMMRMKENKHLCHTSFFCLRLHCRSKALPSPQTSRDHVLGWMTWQQLVSLWVTIPIGSTFDPQTKTDCIVLTPKQINSTPAKIKTFSYFCSHRTDNTHHEAGNIKIHTT